MTYKYIVPKNNSVNQGNYFWFENGFNDDEIEGIHKLADDYEYREGEIFSGVVDKYRRSKVKWLKYNDKSEWLYKKVFNLANIANDKCFNFQIHYAEDAFQYTLYEAENAGKYDWHLDIGTGTSSLRKLSAVVLLTDPSEFEGGELEVFISKSPRKVPLKKGSIVFFPSFFLHRVTELTKGTRQTLVLWIGGDHYR
jgi:PKHD-type hydroxylase